MSFIAPPLINNNETENLISKLDGQQDIEKPILHNSHETSLGNDLKNKRNNREIRLFNPKDRLHKSKNEILFEKTSSFNMNPQIPQILMNMKTQNTSFNSFLQCSQQKNEQFNLLTKMNDIHINDSKEELQGSKHKKFSEEEDEMLKRVVYTFGPKNWRLIASLIPGRTPRQCRDRYANYLAPGFVRTEWSEEEDKLLAEKFVIYGTKWTQIRQFFPFRTANDIKNRYNYTVSRKFNLLKSENHDIKQSKDRTLFNEKENTLTEKVSNDIFLNAEFIEFNHEQYCLFNEELQVNEFDYSFINE